MALARYSRFTGAGLGLVVLAATACGSSSGSATPASTPAASQQPTSAAARPAAVTPIAALPPKPSAAQVNPCTLMTASEAEAILGPLRDPPKLGATNDECIYTTTDGNGAFVDLAGDTSWELTRSMDEDNKEDYTPVSGLGEQAFASTDTSGLAQLTIHQTPYIVMVRSGGGPNINDTEGARKVAETILSHLK